jgi:hypothetical protein
MIENIKLQLDFEMTSIDLKGEATLVCNREVVLDRIVHNLDQYQDVRLQLLEDIKYCFSISLIDAENIYFSPDRSKAVLHHIVRGLLRINLHCAESRLKYYGDDNVNLKRLILAVNSTSGFDFDKTPPNVPSKNHPCFTKSTVEGQRASKLYGALEALRRSLYKKDWRNKKLNSKTADKISSSSSSSSTQLSSVLGKRASSPIESLINAAASVEENKGKMIGLDPSAKENGTRDLREDLDATEDSVEMARGSTNVCELYLFNFFHLFYVLILIILCIT